MCTEEQNQSVLAKLGAIETELGKLRREPQTSVRNPAVIVDANRSWTLDYKGRKHCFIWVVSSTLLSFGEFGSFTVSAQSWTNLGMPEGTVILAPSAGTTGVTILTCQTDESLP